MADAQIIQEMQAAIDALPANIRSQLLKKTPALATSPVVVEEEDFIAIKMELIKFSSDLLKHNQGVNWETNKLKPQEIEVETIIVNSQKLFEFITEQDSGYYLKQWMRITHPFISLSIIKFV